MTDGRQPGKDRSSWVLLILIVAVLAVGAYWFWPTLVPGDQEPAVQIDEPEPATPDLPDPGVDLPVQGIADSPDTWVGMTVGGDAVPVDEVVTPNVSWITDGPARVPVVMISTDGALPEVQDGGTVEIRDGSVQRPEWLDDIPEGTLDEESRAVLRDVPAFIVVDAANLTPGVGV